MGVSKYACSCAHLWKEFRSPIFSLEEPPVSAHVVVDVEDPSKATDEFRACGPAGGVLDVKQTFGVCGDGVPYLSIFIKSITCAWAIAVLGQSIAKQTHPEFWIALLSYWGWIVTNLYFLCSIACTLFLSRSQFRQQGQSSAGWLPNLTWSLFAMALPAEILICILYWVLDYDGNLDYVRVMVHGGGILLIIVDGVVVNRIPIRAKQLIFSELLSVTWIIWSIIHDLAGIGNPNRNDGDPDTDDDSIYGAISWKNSTTSAVVLSVAVVLVVNPLLFLLCRFITRLPPRRLLLEVSANEKAMAIELPGDDTSGSATADVRVN